MTVLRIRGFALPDGEPIDLFADGDRWTDDPVPGAELAAEGWLLPGLVDAHTHPGAEDPGKPLDEALLRDDLRAHLAAGVTMIRSPGLAGDPPAWFGQDDDLPRAVHAGPWIAQHGQFFDGWGRRADHAGLPAVAAPQAPRTGWPKHTGAWGCDNGPPPPRPPGAAGPRSAGTGVLMTSRCPRTSWPRSSRRCTTPAGGSRCTPSRRPGEQRRAPPEGTPRSTAWSWVPRR